MKTSSSHSPEPDPDDNRIRLHLMEHLDTLPTVRHIEDMFRALTRREPTPEDTAKAQRIPTRRKRKAQGRRPAHA